VTDPVPPLTPMTADPDPAPPTLRRLAPAPPRNSPDQHENPTGSAGSTETPYRRKDLTVATSPAFSPSHSLPSSIRSGRPGEVTPISPRRYRRTKAQALVYTVAEVSELLALSLGSTYTLVREGSIPAVRMGGRWLIPKKRFHTWLDSLDSVEAEVA
jgi:excisionase family DNA binding protein